jgi:hypothetical protein
MLDPERLIANLRALDSAPGSFQDVSVAELMALTGMTQGPDGRPVQMSNKGRPELLTLAELAATFRGVDNGASVKMAGNFNQEADVARSERAFNLIGTLVARGGRIMNGYFSLQATIKEPQTSADFMMLTAAVSATPDVGLTSAVRLAAPPSTDMRRLTVATFIHPPSGIAYVERQDEYQVSESDSDPWMMGSPQIEPATMGQLALAYFYAAGAFNALPGRANAAPQIDLSDFQRGQILKSLKFPEPSGF